MLVTCWSAKGGSGTTTVAVALAAILARRHDDGCLLVDLGGDVPAVAGLDDAAPAGIAEWLAGGEQVPADGLARLERPLGAGVRLIPRGSGPIGDLVRARVLAQVLAADVRPVVVDAGVVVERDVASPAQEVARLLAVAAGRSLLVTRACYVALRRAEHLSLRPSGIVLVQGDGRALGRHDVEQVLGVPVVSELAEDRATARRVDHGLLLRHLPRSVERSLRGAV